jgi:dTDP-4-dehydrorhamnose reductase
VILLFGAGGQLGQELVALAVARREALTGLSSAQADIADREAVARAMAAARPSLVVNAAAYTHVDRAECEPDRATRSNAEGATILAQACREAALPLVHLSTDYVFDGTKTEPYVESDPTGPQSAYGRTKLAGEHALAEAGPNHAIVRTAWLYGAGGPNFVETMLRLAGERDEVSVVTDQVGSPTWTVHLAEGLVELAERESDVGILHATGGGACSWYELAVEVFDRAGVRCRVLPTTSDRFPRPARRPAYSVLGTERDESPVLPPWQDGVAAYLSEKAVVAR